MQSNEEIWPKSMGTAVGIPAGYISALGLTGFTTLASASLAVSAPIVIGSLIGVLILGVPNALIAPRIDQSFALDVNPIANRCCHFLLQAASITLGILLGLALTCAFMSIIANPFSLPALIAGGISASIMLGIYMMTTRGEPQYRPPSEVLASSPEILTEALKKSCALLNRGNTPFRG